MIKKTFIIAFLLLAFIKVTAQEQAQDSTSTYKKRVLESTEVDLLTSYYSQDGDNAAVSGGIGTEKLTDFTPTIVVAIPLNDDDVLTIDAGVSAYTSASSSNIDPFDGYSEADAFQASSGASSSDLWANVNGTYSHSSDDRNTIWSAKASISSEYDYSSFGFGGSYTRLFNEKNTELSVSANVYLDTWKLLYPIELRPFVDGGNGINNPLFSQYNITGNANYAPSFTEINGKSRNSYSVGFNFSQILSKRMQGSLAVDLVQQDGLLSTPFQRIYFSDVADSFIESFQLADDIERMPDTRFKVALGGRLNFYLNETFVVRSYYRYYFDDWGISSHTASLEIPIKITDKFTVYPSYRYYSQTAADYFAPYEQHLSTDEFYTSDYDLSDFTANQYGFGVTYTDIFTKFHILNYGLKSIDLKFNHYERNSPFNANIIAGGFKFIMD
ncbi:DUF3570 domain-containing protein [Leeuwenhoekiella sp. A16]|uniref:DUF3570 domain-containing protein n=1 Tax=unclassified Leeuwenhoekiella TaxID=2615029 RepID=UPI003A810285